MHIMYTSETPLLAVKYLATTDSQWYHKYCVSVHLIVDQMRHIKIDLLL